MDKLQMQSKNLVDENIEFIAKRFPNCVTEALDEEGKLTKLVDFDMLKQELSHVVIDGDKERYTMTWPDKKQAILTANAPIAKTLRPCREESVDFDHTQNLYIEGDNLDVLKLLRETYLGKIKMIYIDPPYNTGNDFVYNDDFAEDSEDFLTRDNQKIDGYQMVQNLESNGRFHTDWLNMIYSRIKLARDLLTDDGVIAISIDKNELTNLDKVCSEIFGSKNFISIMPRKTSEIVRVLADYELQNINDYILLYCKNIECVKLIKKVVGEMKYEYKDEKGFYTLKAFQNSGENGTRTARPNLYYPIYFNGKTKKLSLSKEDEDCIEILPRRVMNDDGRWLWSKEKFLQDNEMLEYKNGTLHRKVYFDENDDQNKYQAEKTWLDMFPNRLGAKALSDLQLNGLFDYSKPVELIEFLIKIVSNKNDTILDFFSGSATTAQAVMELNAIDNMRRNYILVQLPETTDRGSFKNICEIGKERIRRAGKKIKEENQMTALNLDVGFRDLKLDSSCMKDIYYSPNKTTQDLLTQFEDNIKEDRTPEDLLFQVMLDMGVMLSSEIKTLEINGKKVFNVNDGDLVCCFDKNINDEVVTAIAKMQPLYAVFRDASMSTDSVAVNFDQIFETYSPTTTRKVI